MIGINTACAISGGSRPERAARMFCHLHTFKFKVITTGTYQKRSITMCSPAHSDRCQDGNTRSFVFDFLPGAPGDEADC